MAGYRYWWKILLLLWKRHGVILVRSEMIELTKQVVSTMSFSSIICSTTCRLWNFTMYSIAAVQTPSPRRPGELQATIGVLWPYFLPLQEVKQTVPLFWEEVHFKEWRVSCSWYSLWPEGLQMCSQGNEGRFKTIREMQYFAFEALDCQHGRFLSFQSCVEGNDKAFSHFPSPLWGLLPGNLKRILKEAGSSYLWRPWQWRADLAWPYWALHCREMQRSQWRSATPRTLCFQLCWHLVSLRQLVLIVLDLHKA